MAVANPAAAETRIALVVTNQAYTQAGARLTNTHHDGQLVKAALEKVGFKVWVVKDTANEGALLQAIGDHVRRLAEAGPDAVGFFYYSSHGAADRPNGENFLIPTDAPLAHVSQLSLLAVRLEKITSSLASTGKMSFVVFDACRNVPLLRDTKDLGFKGFAPVREQNGLLVAFATEPGNVAVDQSLYARALAEAIVTPGLEAGQVFRRVRLRVRADTGQLQSPEYLDKRDQDFHFALAAPIREVTPSLKEDQKPKHPSPALTPQRLENCDDVSVACLRGGMVVGMISTNLREITCREEKSVLAADLKWKNIWTTSAYSYAPSGGGPGGGLENEVLRIGGWGDWYYSLLQFEVPKTQRRIQFAAIILFAKADDGAPVAMYLDRITQPWGWRVGDRLWWKDKPATTEVAMLPAPRIDKWYAIDVTTIVQEWQSGKIANYGLQLRPTVNNKNYSTFHSSLSPEQSKRPRLLFCWS